jgi:mono/diheme cytochrome c family protein
MKLLFLFLVPVFLTLTGWNQPPVSKAIMERGKLVYDKTCLSCHMDNGMGVPRMNPSLVKSKYVLGTKTKMIRIVLRGSEEFSDDPEREYKNTMAALPNLTDQEIADVLTYVRNSYGNKATVVTPGDVKYVKARMK